MNIDLQHMVLDMTSEHKPHFFEAYPSLPELNEEKRDELHECLDDGDTCYMRPIDRTYQLETALDRYTLDTLWDKFDEHLWTIKDVGDYKVYKSVYQLATGDQYAPGEFGVFRMTEVESRKLPHTKAVAYHSHIPSNEKHFLHGELLITLRMMLGQFKKKRYIQHMIAPVLLFSLFGKQGRVLESYVDGQNLVLRRTKIYGFRNDASKAFRDFAEWYLGDPTGDTTCLKKEYELRLHA